MNLDTDASTFAAMLLKLARGLPIEKNPFVHSVCAGKYSRKALAIYGIRASGTGPSMMTSIAV
jgi:hypothetical protein